MKSMQVCKEHRFCKCLTVEFTGHRYFRLHFVVFWNIQIFFSFFFLFFSFVVVWLRPGFLGNFIQILVRMCSLKRRTKKWGVKQEKEEKVEEGWVKEENEREENVSLSLRLSRQLSAYPICDPSFLTPYSPILPLPDCLPHPVFLTPHPPHLYHHSPSPLPYPILHPPCSFSPSKYPSPILLPLPPSSLLPFIAPFLHPSPPTPFHFPITQAWQETEPIYSPPRQISLLWFDNKRRWHVAPCQPRRIISALSFIRQPHVVIVCLVWVKKLLGCLLCCGMWSLSLLFVFFFFLLLSLCFSLCMCFSLSFSLARTRARPLL